MATLGDIERALKRLSLPGFRGLSVWDVGTFFISEIKNDNIITRANSMAFSFFISLFPLLLVSLSISTWIPQFSASNIIEMEMASLLPENAEEFLSSTITELRQKSSGVFSIGFLLALFFSSNGMLNMMRGFDKGYSGTFVHRSPLKKRAIAILLIVLLFVLALVSVAFIILGRRMTEFFLDFMNLGLYASWVLTFVKWTTLVLIFYAVIGILYRYGPAYKRKMKFINPGATLATVLSILSSLALSFYVNRFDTYNEIYGSIGALIVVMLWLQLNSLVLLIGFELNTSIAYQGKRSEQI